MMNSTEARLIWCWTVLAIARTRGRTRDGARDHRARGERGEIAQTVIIVAILAAAAIAIATIIATKFKDKATSIPTE